jgi:hypothetical protein
LAWPPKSRMAVAPIYRLPNVNKPSATPALFVA